MEKLLELLTIQNGTLVVGIIVFIFFLRSKVVKQLIDNLKQLGNVQESLLKAKDLEIEILKEQITELESKSKIEIAKLEKDLAESKERNRVLRADLFDDQQELSEFRKLQSSVAPNKEK